MSRIRRLAVSVALAATLGPHAPARAAIVEIPDVTITSVRTTSRGSVILYHSGPAVCGPTSLVVVPKEHADRAGTTSVALAALLAKKKVVIYVNDAVTEPLGASDLCTVLGLRIDAE